MRLGLPTLCNRVTLKFSNTSVLMVTSVRRNVNERPTGPKKKTLNRQECKTDYK